MFRAITVPLAGPALAAGLVMSWARALGEFGATIMFAGNVAGRTQTLPLVVYAEFQGGELDASIAAAAILVARGPRCDRRRAHLPLGSRTRPANGSADGWRWAAPPAPSSGADPGPRARRQAYRQAVRSRSSVEGVIRVWYTMPSAATTAKARSQNTLS